MSNPWAIPENSTDSGDIFFSRTFHSRPSVLAASLVLPCFVIFTIIAFVLTAKYGGRFMYIIPATGAVEVLGYALRIVTIEQKTLTPYIVSSLFILVAPIALALVNYIVVAKLLRVAKKPVSIFRCWELQPERFAKVFFWSDMACLFFQCSGSGLLAAGKPGMADIGTGITLFGLIIQISFFLAFVWILRRTSTVPSFGLRDLPSLSKVFLGLWITTSCLFVRNVYRIIEYASGSSGPVHTREWTFYVFETFPLLIAFMAYCMFHFGKLLESTSTHPEWIREFELIQAGAKALPITRDEEHVHSEGSENKAFPMARDEEHGQGANSGNNRV